MFATAMVGLLMSWAALTRYGAGVRGTRVITRDWIDWPDPGWRHAQPSSLRGFQRASLRLV